MATRAVILAAVNGDTLVDNAAEDVAASVVVRDTTPTRSNRCNHHIHPGAAHDSSGYVRRSTL